MEDDGDGELDAIRERKRERLLGAEAAGAETGTEAPDEPVGVDGETHLSEVLDSHRLVLVDFYADWCGPCGAMEPAVEAVAADTEAVVAKVDIDAHQGLAAESNVRGVPTLVLYADGEPVERLVGLQDETRLRSLVDEH